MPRVHGVTRSISKGKRRPRETKKHPAPKRDFLNIKTAKLARQSRKARVARRLKSNISPSS